MDILFRMFLKIIFNHQKGGSDGNEIEHSFLQQNIKNHKQRISPDLSARYY